MDDGKKIVLRSQFFLLLVIGIAVAIGFAFAFLSARDGSLGAKLAASSDRAPIDASRDANAKIDEHVVRGRFRTKEHDSSGLHQHLLTTSQAERNHVFSMILSDARTECASVVDSEYVAADITTWQVHCTDNISYSVAIAKHGTPRVFPIPSGDFNRSSEILGPVEPD